MGYTHYWTPNETLTSEQRKKMVDFTKEAIKLSGVTIKGGNGEGLPTVSKKSIRFNGNGDSGHSHETFCLLEKSDWWSDCCKTAMKPYDDVVVACLIYADEIDVIKEWSSDGSLIHGEFNRGLTLYSRVTGVDLEYKYNFMKNLQELDKEFNV